MKKIIIALAATSALTIAMPAAAQNAGGNLQLRVGQLQTQLQAGVQSGAISRAEAMPLRDQLRQLTRLERQYARGGISGRERADLQHRINSLRQGIRTAERTRDRDDRYGGNDRGNDRWDGRDDDRDGRREAGSRYDNDRDGWDDRDRNRDGRWDVDGRYDSNRDGWDDRDANRDGRWDDDQDGRRDQADNGGGLLGQIIGSVTGGGGLRVGQRASAGLYGVPDQYRDRYRDGNGAYYRSDGRQIYQIDARTHLVARVFPMSR